MADIEFSLEVQKWSLEIFLYDECPELAIGIPLLPLQTNNDVFEGVTDCNAVTTVGKLTRLNNPDILQFIDSPLFSDFIVKFYELFVFWVFSPFTDVECHW